MEDVHRNETSSITNAKPFSARRGMKMKEQIMKHTDLETMRVRRGLTIKTILLAATLLLAAALTLHAGTDNRAPDAPAAIAVPDGNKVHFHAYAIGAQIYTWNGTVWTFTGPDAVLFDADGKVVGTHFAYAGPTRPGWRSNSGSLVVGAAITNAPSATPNSVPQLLVDAVAVNRPGIFAATTYIQRINTVGGRAPSTDGTSIGEVARQAYSAEYYFYREES